MNAEQYSQRASTFVDWEGRIFRIGRRFSWTAFIAIWTTAFLIVCLGFEPASAIESDVAAEDVGIVTLINGDSVSGRIMENSDGQIIRWQADAFIEPFDFRFSSVKSIKFPNRKNEPIAAAPFAVELMNGDSISGRILRWDESSVTIDAIGFGELRLRPDSIRGLYRPEQDSSAIMARLAGKQSWDQPVWQRTGWAVEGDHVWTQQVGSEIVGPFDFPPQALIDLVLSWSGRPGFQIALGDRQPGRTAWMLAAEDNELVIQASGANSDDAARTTLKLIDLSQAQSIRLSIAVDSVNGTIHCFAGDGSLLGSLADRNSANRIDRFQLINRGESLRLERFRIADWRGAIPDRLTGTAAVATSDGSIVCGVLRQIDTDAGRLRLNGGDEASLQVDQVLAIQTRQFATMPAQPQCALFLRDGQRLSGDLQAVGETAWILAGRHFDQPVEVSRSLIRSMVVFNNDAVAIDADVPAGRAGRLELDQSSLQGRLAPSPDAAATHTADNGGDPVGMTGLRWHPFGAINSSGLLPSASGRIVYRDPPELTTSNLAAQAMEMQRQRLQQQRRGLNFGELFLKRVDSVGATEPERDAHAVHIRTGDVIACRVESIDQQGVRVSTVNNDDQLIPHDHIKAIELGVNSPPPDLSKAKRERLLTIPRLQKSLPPTHLLCSFNSDFLRCQVLEMDSHRVVVEVQSEQIELPRERIAQMIWFHDEEWKTDDQPTTDRPVDDRADSLQGFAQVLQRDGRRVTFVPTGFDGNTVFGHSTIVGPCRFRISDVDQLIFGERIAEEVSGLVYNQWTLHPAIEPLVTQGAGGLTGSKQESSLIGKIAPAVYLVDLDGAEIQLTDYRGRIIVLDFWASWCAPCMVTMPKVEAVIADQDPDQVMLLSVNVGETAEHVRGVMERHQLKSPVALDIDGAAGVKYQAESIPQWVVIDRDGRIAAVHVGAGEESIERLESAIAELLGEP